jgi:hypothetical protein
MVTFTAIGKVLEPVDRASEPAIPLPDSPDEEEARFARLEAPREAGLVAAVVLLHLDLGSNPCTGRLAPKILPGSDALVSTDRE